MPVKIHGKDYKTVAERISEFREAHPLGSIKTDMVQTGDLSECIIRASITIDGVEVATGTAHEVRDSSNINATSHIENAETSAVGRALAFFNYAGSEIASADEVAAAIKQQGAKDAEKRAAEHMQAVRDLWPSITQIKTGIDVGNLSMAHEAWSELSDDEKRALWVAPSKGGVFTTKERAVMQSTEFRTANGEH